MAVTYTLFIRKDVKNRSGKHPIYLRITSDRKHRYVSTGESVRAKDWNADKEQVRGASGKAINARLKKHKERAQEAQGQLMEYGSDDSSRAIRDRLKVSEKADFFTIGDELLLEYKLGKKFYAEKTLKVVLGKMERFRGGHNLPLKYIDSDFFEKLESFMRVEYGNGDSTVNKNFEPIRVIVKRALKAHLMRKNPFVEYEVPGRKNPKIKARLSPEQIGAIEQLDLEPETPLWHTRNAFLFSYYSGGIRFGDICCLRFRNVRNGRLSYKMNKNQKDFSTELNEHQRRILSQYEGNLDHFIFPFLNKYKDHADPIELRKGISSRNVIVNKNLKTIVDTVNEKIDNGQINAKKIEGVISFHTSRHSFAQFAVNAGLSVYELMHTLRHSKLETTSKYLKGLDQELADKAMQRVFKTNGADDERA